MDNRNLLILLLTVEEIEIEMVWVYTKTNTVVFQHNNRWKEFLHIK